MNLTMHYSKDGLHLTEQFEGCKLKAYPDSTGIPTIGYGHTSGVHLGMTCTQQEAEQWLTEDIAWAETEVNKLVQVPLDQGQFDALVDFTFNLGAGTLQRSTALKELNAGHYDAVPGLMEQYDRAGGKVLTALEQRRADEAKEWVA